MMWQGQSLVKKRITELSATPLLLLYLLTEDIWVMPEELTQVIKKQKKKPKQTQTTKQLERESCGEKLKKERRNVPGD